MASTAQRLSKASQYGGASRMQYLSEYVSTSCSDGKYHRVIDYYPSLMESAVEFKRAWRLKKQEPEGEHDDTSSQFNPYLNIYQNNQTMNDATARYIDTQSETIMVSKFYCLIKHP